MRIKLTNAEGEVLHISPGTMNELIYLSGRLAHCGVKVERVNDDGKYGLASGRRFPAEDLDKAERPPLTPMGETLFRESVRLIAKDLTEGK